MVEITHKNTSLRKATAQATVAVSKQETIDAIVNKNVPKGDVFEMAKTAGLFAVKKTSDMIPDCHPLPVEFTQVSYDIDGLENAQWVSVERVWTTPTPKRARSIAIFSCTWPRITTSMDWRFTFRWKCIRSIERVSK